MYRDGYLIKCPENSLASPRLVYCEFGDGILSYYSDIGHILLGRIYLVGHLTQVYSEPNVLGKFPNRFIAITNKVHQIDGRKMKIGERKTYEFAAPSHDLMKEWANSLHLWRRLNWKENYKFFKETTEMTLQEQKSVLFVYTEIMAQSKEKQEKSMKEEWRENCVKTPEYQEKDWLLKSYSHSLRLGKTLMKAASPSVKKIRRHVIRSSAIAC